MTLETIKKQNATTRFSLVRLTPARFISDDLVDSGTSGTTLTLYTMEFPYISIDKIEVNGTEIPRATAISINSPAQHYAYDEATKSLEVGLDDPPNDTDNIVIIFYNIMFTGEKYRDFHEDPLDDTTARREWQPVLTSYPETSQSIKNIREGIFTIAPTRVKLIDNRDKVNFQQYLTLNDSFNNKSFKVWQVIKTDDDEVIRLAFQGNIVSLSLDGQSISIQCNDSFNRLLQPALMGDDENEAYARRSADSYPTLQPNENNNPIPYILGTRTKRNINEGTGVILSPMGTVTGLEIDEISAELRAKNVDYLESAVGNANRSFVLCRTSSGGIKDLNGGTIQSIEVTGPGNFDQTWITVSDPFAYEPGDQFVWTEGATQYNTRIDYVGTAVNPDTSIASNLVLAGSGWNITTSSTINNSPALYVELRTEVKQNVGTNVGKEFILDLRQNIDVTIQETATSGGNRTISITLPDNWESFYTGIYGSERFDPLRDEIYFYLRTEDGHTHSDSLQRIVEKSGLEVEQTSFDQAFTDLSVNTIYQIPEFNEKSYKNYAFYAENLLASTLGYLLVNNDLEIEYHLLKSPAPSESRGSSLIIDKTASLSVNYKDIQTTIVGKNVHAEDTKSMDSGEASPSVASAKSRLLHGVENVTILNHVLDDISPRLQDHIDLKSNRTAIYSFSTATEDIDTEIGDDLTIDNDVVAGSDTTEDVKIISTRKSSTKTTLKGDDLGELT